MNDKLVNWTHWYEEFPSYARKCIIVKETNSVFFGRRIKIFLDDGCLYNVRKDRLIPFSQPKHEIILCRTCNIGDTNNEYGCTNPKCKMYPFK